jgi:hypothetical protein
MICFPDCFGSLIAENVVRPASSSGGRRRPSSPLRRSYTMPWGDAPVFVAPHPSAPPLSRPLSSARATSSPPRPSSSSPTRSRQSSIGPGSGGSGGSGGTAVTSSSHRSRSADMYSPPSSASTSPTEPTSPAETKNCAQNYQHNRNQTLTSLAAAGAINAQAPLGLAIRQSSSGVPRSRRGFEGGFQAASGRRETAPDDVNAQVDPDTSVETSGPSLLATSWSWSTF